MGFSGFFWNHRIWLITILPLFFSWSCGRRKYHSDFQRNSAGWQFIQWDYQKLDDLMTNLTNVEKNCVGCTWYPNVDSKTQLSIMYWYYTVSKIIQNNLYSLQFRELKMHHMATVSDYTCKLDNYKPSQLQVLQHVTVLVIKHHPFSASLCFLSFAHGRLFAIAGSAHRRLGSIRRSEISTKWWMTILWRLRYGKPTIDEGQFSKGNHGNHGVFHIF